MLTKGIVETLVDEFTAKVRIPIYNGVKTSRDFTPDADLNNATICATNNTANIIHEGDIVYVSFEDNDISKPVILGLLHRASESSNINNMQDYNVRILNVNSTAKLTHDTYIGNITPTDINNLFGTKGNIQDQINTCDNRLTTLEQSIQTISDNAVYLHNEQIIDGKKTLTNINNSIITGYLDVRGTAIQHKFMTRGIVGSDGAGTIQDLYLQYDTNFPTHFGTAGNSTLNTNGSITLNNAATISYDSTNKCIKFTF